MAHLGLTARTTTTTKASAGLVEAVQALGAECVFARQRDGLLADWNGTKAFHASFDLSSQKHIDLKLR